MCSALQVVDQLVIPDRLRQETPTSPSLTRYVLSTRLSSMPCIGFEWIGDKLLKLPSSYSRTGHKNRDGGRRVTHAFYNILLLHPFSLELILLRLVNLSLSFVFMPRWAPYIFLLFHSLHFELRTVSLRSKHYQSVNPMNPLLLEHVGTVNGRQVRLCSGCCSKRYGGRQRDAAFNLHGLSYCSFLEQIFRVRRLKHFWLNQGHSWYL